jgi:acetyl esterase/lipase
MRTRIAVSLLLTAIISAVVGCSGATAPPTTPIAPSTATTTTPTDVLPSPTVPSSATISPTATLASTREPTPSPQPTAPRPANTPALGSIQKDVTYCTPEGDPQKMDLYFPKVSDGKPAPVVVYVHGGAWREGDKAEGGGMSEMPLLSQRGYLFVSINYRLAPRWKWPVQIQDVKCAIRFLRAHAKSYNLDPNRIGAMGSSAGGHLVALLGVTDTSAGFDVGEYLDQSSRVQAVVDLFGPADLTVKHFTETQGNTVRMVFGAQAPGDPVLKQASPVTYISKDDPPFLILQGDKDTTVPPSQSQELYDRLKAGGVTATLVMVKNAGHGFVPAGGAVSPSLAELAKTILDFYDRYLGKTTSSAP